MPTVQPSSQQTTPGVPKGGSLIDTATAAAEAGVIVQQALQPSPSSQSSRPRGVPTGKQINHPTSSGVPTGEPSGKPTTQWFARHQLKGSILNNPMPFVKQNFQLTPMLAHKRSSTQKPVGLTPMLAQERLSTQKPLGVVKTILPTWKPLLVKANLLTRKPITEVAKAVASTHKPLPARALLLTWKPIHLQVKALSLTWKPLPVKAMILTRKPIVMGKKASFLTRKPIIISNLASVLGLPINLPPPSKKGSASFKRN